MLIDEETQMFSRVTFIGHFKYYLQIRFADVNVYTHHIEQFIQSDGNVFQKRNRKSGATENTCLVI